MGYMKKVLFLGLFCFYTTGCQTTSGRYVENLFPEGPDVSTSTAPLFSLAPQTFISTEPSVFFEPIPEAMNSSVQKWLDYFQGRGRKYMSIYLSRYTKYKPLMTSLLREAGLPEDLIYVVFIESGFNGGAKSRVAATGYWQFMKRTGRYYNLKINRHVDERRDPELSTLAAIEYFKSLYSLFGSWYLSLAAYNAGENKIKRIVMTNQSRDFWEIAHKMPVETTNYVPKFLAARMIAKNPKKYGFTDIAYEPELRYIKVPIEKPVDLTLMARHSGISRSVLKELNPSTHSHYLPIFSDKTQYLKLPAHYGKEGVLQTALSKSYISDNDLYMDSPVRYHRVRRGETVSHIARRFGTRPSAIRDMNSLRRNYHIRAGQLLKIPGKNWRKPANARKSIHIVKRGETLFSISKKYKVSMTRLASVNSLKNRSLIQIGKRLVIPFSK